MWRVVIYMLAPAALISGVLFIQQGMPMTYRSQYQVSTLEPGAIGTITEGHAKPQTIVVGPVGAVVPIKMLGTNGGGFYGTNSAHPFENPSALELERLEKVAASLGTKINLELRQHYETSFENLSADVSSPREGGRPALHGRFADAGCVAERVHLVLIFPRDRVGFGLPIR